MVDSSSHSVPSSIPSPAIPPGDTPLNLLRQLALAYGIQWCRPARPDQESDEELIPVQPESLRAALKALGVVWDGDVLDESAIRAELTRWERGYWYRISQSIQVLHLEQPDKALVTGANQSKTHHNVVNLQLPRHALAHPKALKVTWHLEVDEGTSSRKRVASGHWSGKDFQDSRIVRKATLQDGTDMVVLACPLEPMLTPLTHGYYTLHIHWDNAGAFLSEHVSLIPEEYRHGGFEKPRTVKLVVAPPRSFRSSALKPGERYWGPSLNLYGMNSHHNLGMGDTGDVRDLVHWCQETGAATLGLSPLNALGQHSDESLWSNSTPENPSTRYFHNIYLADVEEIPEFKESDEAHRLTLSPGWHKRVEQFRAADTVPYGDVVALKREVLWALYQTFVQTHLARKTERGQHFRDFQRAGGNTLKRWAVYEALQDEFSRSDEQCAGWTDWSEGYQCPESPLVEQFAENNREIIEFFQYVQWNLEDQIQKIGWLCFDLKLPLGIYLGCPAQVDLHGAEVWSNRDAYITTARLGTQYFQTFETPYAWYAELSSPPWNPEYLKKTGYGPLIDLLRFHMRHAGAVHIQDIETFFNLFWVPEGIHPDDPVVMVDIGLETLMAVCSLESHRNQCVLTSEFSVSAHGPLRPTLVSLVERYDLPCHHPFLLAKDSEGAFKPVESFPEDGVIALGPHKFPTLADFWHGLDIQEYMSVVDPELASPAEDDIIRSHRDGLIRNRVVERFSLLQQLAAHHLLPEGVTTDPASIRTITLELVAAWYRLMAMAPTRLELFRLEDITNLTHPAQESLLQGMEPPEFWCRKYEIPVEGFSQSMALNRVVEALVAERGRFAGSGTPVEALREQARERQSALPGATYRMQFHKDFTFKDAMAQIPYIAQLGVTHLYTSPLLRARTGSNHGYDIMDHGMINPEIGTEEEFTQLVHTLHEYKMGMIVDIVPNHMGIGKENPWWMDVLENGPASSYSDYFDIDWRPIKAELFGKVLIPVLGGPYGEILSSGQLKLSFDLEQGRLMLHYWDHQFPINPVSYPQVLRHRIDILEARLGASSSDLMEYESIITALERLPVHMEASAERLSVRIREKQVAFRRLAALCQHQGEVVRFIEENLSEFIGGPDDQLNIERMHQLLEAQAYRLAYWRTAVDEINYRRFFDINDLAAIRVEDPRVFMDTHQTFFNWVHDGLVDGFRVDHPDGLFDPTDYFQRLQDEAARQRRDTRYTQLLDAPEPEDYPLYVVVEKILAPFENLDDSWAAHGTTGYDFLNAMDGVLVDQGAEQAMERIYHKFLGHGFDYEATLFDCKRLILNSSLTSELTVLAHRLNRISEGHWSFRDFTLNSLRSALLEVITYFPVYRTYVAYGQSNSTDEYYVNWAVNLAKKHSKNLDISIFDFIWSVLLVRLDDTADEGFRMAVEDFAMKFQQITGPVMAKSLEDTLFYRYNRLSSLNEVGGEPNHFGCSVAAFHRQNAERQRRWPYAMINSTTHDTKRSEDVRARLHVLADIPVDWQKAVSHWSKLNRLRKTEVDDEAAPTRNDEYLIYQAMVGTWPLEPMDGEAMAVYMQRIEDYILKAIREAKDKTSWIHQNQAYEEAVRQFIQGLFKTKSKDVTGNACLRHLESFQEVTAYGGALNSLAMVAMKLTCPGVPDVYQGQELWDFSLVDPDNRRPVDYDRRQNALEEMGDLTDVGLLGLSALTPEDIDRRLGRIRELWTHWTDGRIKLWLSALLLSARHRWPALFTRGEYLPLDVEGPCADHVIAYVRQWEGHVCVVVIPRSLTRLMEAKGVESLEEIDWGNTQVLLPEWVTRCCDEERYGDKAGFCHLGTGYTFRDGELMPTQGEVGHLWVSQFLNTLPMAVLMSRHSWTLPPVETLTGDGGEALSNTRRNGNGNPASLKEQRVTHSDSNAISTPR